MRNKTQQFYQFGSYRLLPDRRLLLDGDKPVPVQPKAFDILLALVENSETVVSKEDLLKKVWPDTFVEESNLAQNIFVLRKTLGDSVEEKRYIVTVPGRGYRFAEKVTVVHEAQLAPKSSAADVTQDDDRLIVETHTLSRIVVEEHQVPGARGRRLALVVIASALAVVIAAVFLWTHRRPKLSEKDTILLADFDNRAGDPDFDGALRQGLSAELEQSPFLNLVSDERISRTLTLMTQPKDSRLNRELAQVVCQRTGSAAVLNATISQIGTRYLLTLQAVNCVTGESLASAEAEASDKNHVLDALGKLAGDMRGKLGESLPSVQRFAVPIEATTSSLEALKTLSVGINVFLHEGDAPSIPFFKRAVELDPNFPLAYYWLSQVYRDLLQPSLALDYSTKAYRLRDRGTEREKLRITLGYFDATGELDKEAETCELWITDYPRDALPYGVLGHIYQNVGQYDKALPKYQDFLRLAPAIVISYSYLGGEYIFQDRLDEAKAILDQAREARFDSGNLRQQIYILAFLRGEVAEMQQQVAWAAGKPGAEDILLSEQSDTEAYYGRMNKAREFSRRAVESAVRADSKETAALWQANSALREAELGDATAAKQEIAEALSLSPGRDVKVIAALVLARAGDIQRASEISEELEKAYPTNTLMKLYWLPTIQAAIEIDKHNPSRALLDLEPVAPYELGLADGYINYLYPAYVRGQAYLHAHDGAAAAAEFQKLLDHTGIVENFMTGALARLQIARADAMAGNSGKAKAAYLDFLTLWKGADPDLALLEQAKAEYAKLQ